MYYRAGPITYIGELLSMVWISSFHPHENNIPILCYFFFTNLKFIFVFDHFITCNISFWKLFQAGMRRPSLLLQTCLCRTIWYIYRGLLWFDSSMHCLSGTLTVIVNVLSQYQIQIMNHTSVKICHFSLRYNIFKKVIGCRAPKTQINSSWKTT